jgi:hypothetical protein
MDLVKIGWGDVDWIGLAEYRDKRRALVNAVMNFQVPQGKPLSRHTIGGLFSGAQCQ